MYEIKRYNPDDKQAWNRFVADSKNGTFLFDRNYMDYHQDRFCDCSLMVWRQSRLYAVIPANKLGTTWVSHGGLTYGGLVMDKQCTTAGVIEVFRGINTYLRSLGFREVIYKAVPHIYHRLPAEEDLYALTDVCHARLAIRDVSSAIIGQQCPRFTESRRSGLRKAQRAGLQVRPSDDVAAFWQILNDNLTARYSVKPVHSASELTLLMSRFPDNIRLWMVYDGDVPIAGTLLFLTPQVVHTQYISATEQGKRMGAVDMLFEHLINHVYRDCPYIDFGKSTVSDSADLNPKLIFQKEGFGARAVCYDTYEYSL